ncbi:NlpC/P60 family protein [Olleya sp. HaHaR_3_96]|uniref:NlpC/P60 family protein n=1 Tax=Olleya sp. HaHaR_3_96 TaxID=2745560 RepID=UPI001C4E5FD9|nr:NlpC/P60 family protein [Olleya sp. HaHaR_3_96]QXP59300.1 C40 family peptidase [Olleya sp. HaHaR_3_96]
MKKIILIPTLLLFCILNYAQNSRFEGVVIDAQLSTPIKGAIVTIKDTKFTEATDDDGKFVFTQQLPEGTLVVLVEKNNFTTNIFLIDTAPGLKIEAKEIKLEPNKKELYNRKVTDRELKKQQRIEEKKESERIADIEKELKEKDKLYAKEIKRLAKNKRKGKIDEDTVTLDYKDPNTEPDEAPYTITETQIKYGNILGVDPADLTNVELYNLIEDWDNVPYLYGGNTKKRGIDCSSFTQFIFSSLHKFRLERTASQQYHSDSVDKFKNRGQIFEGDLIFFTGVGESNDEINHVGVYLHNNMFVHSTSNKDNDGNGGVQISDLSEDYWSTKFVSAGRIILDN